MFILKIILLEEFIILVSCQNVFNTTNDFKCDYLSQTYIWIICSFFEDSRDIIYKT